MCPSAGPRPRARQVAGRASRYRAAEVAVVAGPRTDGDAFCGRRSNRRGRRGSLVARLDAPQNVFGAEELAAGDVGLGGKRNGQRSNQALSGRRDGTSTRDL